MLCFKSCFHSLDIIPYSKNHLRLYIINKKVLSDESHCEFSSVGRWVHFSTLGQHE